LGWWRWLLVSFIVPNFLLDLRLLLVRCFRNDQLRALIGITLLLGSEFR
jgi:hypothetical protein